MDEIVRLFPDGLRHMIVQTVGDQWFQLEEIRLRLNRPIEFIFTHDVIWLEEIVVSEQIGQYLLNKITDHSLYRMDTELKEGFITIKGGHRVGLAGEVITLEDQVDHIQYVTFFNIRIAKQHTGIASPLLKYLHHENTYYNTLIIGPPQTGKTSLIRDLARLMGDGSFNLEAKKVAIIDERSEIAAAVNGIPQHDVGLRTDVMDACPKTAGLMMMIRSMSPDVIIVDEIGKKADVEALIDALFAGVNIICTLHGSHLSEVQNRPSLHMLFAANVFDRFIVLERRTQAQFLMTVLDQNETVLYETRCHVL